MSEPKKFKCPKCGEKFCLVDMGISLEGKQLRQLRFHRLFLVIMGAIEHYKKYMREGYIFCGYIR